MRSAPYSVRLGPVTLRQLRELGVAMGETISGVVRRAVDREWREAREVGLIPLAEEEQSDDRDPTV